MTAQIFQVFTVLFFSFSVQATSLRTASQEMVPEVQDLDQRMNQDLHRFHENPKQVMSQLPWKTGQLIPRFETQAPLLHENYLEKKDDLRQRLCRQSRKGLFCPQLGKFKAGPLAPIYESPEEIESFVEGGPTLININAYENLMDGSIQTKPWSDTYWPLAKGALGQRFADPEFPHHGEWLERFNYAGTLDIFKEGPKDLLSPSEKYDVLVNDQKKSLTTNQWNQGRYYNEVHGTVETWMGLCHGWAAASYMLKRPNKTVVIPIKSASGKDEELHFLPTDIKGLATLLWSNTNMDALFIGGRCNEKDPKTDENGRIIDSTCFDMNPGLFHMLVVQRIQANRPFIFDATYDYEVWNQPVLGYAFNYFNPQSLEPQDSLKSAMIKAKDYKKDKFKKYRDPRTKYFVGIKMKVRYLSETSPSTEPEDSPEQDAEAWAGYMYDLELDENFNIIGGEWYTAAHPDFLWTPKLNVRALSMEDYTLKGEWTEKNAFPENWKAAAARASTAGQPLAKIIEKLIEWAQ